MPKIIINDTIIFFLKLQSTFWQFQTTDLTVSECCLINLLPYILFEKIVKCIPILALEMASCIGAFSSPIGGIGVAR